jgi:hypothetical protein
MKMPAPHEGLPVASSNGIRLHLAENQREDYSMSKEWGGKERKNDQEGSKSFLLQETHCHENELIPQSSHCPSQQTIAFMD